MNIHFAPPVNGWILCTMTHQQQELVIPISDVSHDSLEELVWALMDVATSREEAACIFFSEPTEYVFSFSQKKEHVQLQVISYPDSQSRKQKKEGTYHFSFEATPKEIGLLFWRSLRRLETEQDAFAKHWKHAFPSLDLFHHLLRL